MWLAEVISVLQRSAVGTEIKILRADYFSILGSTTPELLPPGWFLIVPGQVDVAQWWQLLWLRSRKYTMQMQLLPVVQPTHVMLIANACRPQILFYTVEMRRKQIALPNPEFYWVFVKRTIDSSPQPSINLCSLLNLVHFDYILHEICTCKLCLTIPSSGFKQWSNTHEIFKSWWVFGVVFLFNIIVLKELTHIKGKQFVVSL